MLTENLKMRFFSSSRNGSAYLFAVGAVSVLVIVVLFYSLSKNARRWTTRYMSDEGKAEALANSAAELALRHIKDVMNDDSASDEWYNYFRLPAPVKAGVLAPGKMGISGGNDAELDISNPKFQPRVFTSNSDVIVQIKKMVESSDHLDLEIKGEIISAAAMTSNNPDYPVVGITIKAKPVNGEEGKFLDSLGAAEGNKGTKNHLESDYIADFKLPNHGNSDSHSIDGVPTGEVELERLGIAKVRCKVKVVGTTVYEKPIDFNDCFRDYVPIPSGANISISEMMKLILLYSTTNHRWAAEKLANAASNRFNSGDLSEIKAALPGDYFSPPVVIEKLGTLRLTITVKFKPQGSTGKQITKVLCAERELKVADVQPPAPEYSFFLANAPKLNETTVPNFTVEDPPDFVYCNAPGTFTVHNLPLKPGEGRGYDFIPGFDQGEPLQVPGMVRINSNSAVKINSFLGTPNDFKATEFNELVLEKIGTPLNCVAQFQWSDRSPARPFDFSLIRQSSVSKTVIGVKNLETLLSECDAFSPPTLLFGDGFFEYPLTLRVEGNIKKRYSTFDVRVKPKGSVIPPKDKSRININYTVKENLGYGLQGLPSDGNYSPNDDENMPPFLYSTLQYAKKAAYFYENESEFWNDSERFEGGVYLADGVSYIKGDLTIPSEFKVKGKGLLVAKGSITINGNVKRVDDRTVFGLIARCGAIEARCSRIEAACYSNLSLIHSAGNMLTIDGNLVCNQFIRNVANSVEIQYNSAACRVSPLSVIRNVGKFEPKRYHVSVGKRWTRFEFQKVAQN